MAHGEGLPTWPCNSGTLCHGYTASGFRARGHDLAHGYIDDDSGLRISATERRFMILDAMVRNVIDGEGSYRGQAAMFAHGHGAAGSI